MTPELKAERFVVAQAVEISVHSWPALRRVRGRAETVHSREKAAEQQALN